MSYFIVLWMCVIVFEIFEMCVFRNLLLFVLFLFGLFDGRLDFEDFIICIFLILLDDFMEFVVFFEFVLFFDVIDFVLFVVEIIVFDLLVFFNDFK